MRKELDLYADIRPIQSYPGVWCLREKLDFIVVRENTQGFLADRNLYKGYGEFMPNEAAALVSSLVPTANIGKGCAVYRPIHEALLDIAGKNVVNPISTILSAMMMLDYLGAFQEAEIIKRAGSNVLARGDLKTRDLGGKSTASEMTQAIVDTIAKEG
ncbi:MAG: isocitrate/isopropylmalate family dehydrogenase [Thermodesulfobacteriota bacterium]|nr:isocitrate/isopropylmalate family dehydrogenase [Thermodesulfobacteriota bacterium]